jgi:LytR cell envelope-related transcriptional attenuator
MQHAEQLTTSFPWRTAALVVSAIAAAELLALIGIGAVRLAPKHSHARAVAAQSQPRPVAHVKRVAPPPSHPLRPRSSVRVLVLNGNGVQGAAASEATRLQVYGYRIGGAQNAQRHDYAQSMVLYVPGWVKEARRLAHESGVRLVAPVDGLKPAQLKGSKLVILLGT